MQIKINGGGLLTGATIGDYQTDLSGYISKSNDIISSFKTVKSQTCSLNGGVSSYTSNAMNDIDHRLAEEEKKREATVTIQNKSNDFLTLAQRVDNEVAKDVNKNKDEFYKTTKFSKPAVQPLEKRWYEKAADWLDWFFSPAKTKKDREKKAKIYKWIITGASIVGSALLIAATGGAGIVLIGAGIGAASGFANNMVDQYVEKGNLIQNFDNIDWGSAVWSAFVGGVTGAITSAIGSGVGGAISKGLANTALGATLLNSSNALVRVLTGFTIGGTAQWIGGIFTRGAATAVESLLTTGTIDFTNVWKIATDKKSMLIDFAMGGVLGGYRSKNKPVGKEIRLEELDNKKIIDSKPMNSPDPERWLKEVNGKIYVDGNGTWTYEAPDGVHVCYNDGYPNFERAGLVENKVDIGSFSDNRNNDFNKANDISPKSETTTWHHHQDGHTLLAVDTKYHKLFTHRGGFSIVNKGG